MQTTDHTVTLGRFRPEPEIIECATEVCGLPFSMRFDLARPSQRYIHDCIERFGAYEPESVEALKKHLQPGDTFFDVGAHCGYFSRLALELVGKVGFVLAFEPDSVNFIAIRKNCPEAMAFPVVIGNTVGKVPFYGNLDNDGGHALWDPAGHPWNEQCAKTKIVPKFIDQWMLDNSLYRPKAIKIDTEGAEVQVLEGARKILAHEQLSLVICELNKFGLQQLGNTHEQLMTIMFDFGFQCSGQSDPRFVSNLIFERK